MTSRIRIVALLALGIAACSDPSSRGGAKQATESVRALERPEDTEVRTRARIREAAGTPARLALVREVLASHPDPKLRVAAAQAFAGASAPVAVESLLPALEDPEPQVVEAAIRSLARADGVEKQVVVAALEPLQDHPDTHVREAAAETLSGLR